MNLMINYPLKPLIIISFTKPAILNRTNRFSQFSQMSGKISIRCIPTCQWPFKTVKSIDEDCKLIPQKIITLGRIFSAISGQIVENIYKNNKQPKWTT